MKIYLDDERQTPPGYVRTYFVEETINLIKQNDGNIEIISLDNDLGIGHEEGYKVLDWIEEQAFHNKIQPILHILIHTANPSAENRMMKARFNAWKYWQQHGYSRSALYEKDYID